jgi:uncharacterized delta-60 repeat protein
MAALAVLTPLLVLNRAAPAWAAPGDLDPTFGIGGVVATDFGAGQVAIQRDGKIVAAGGGLARYNADGTLDPTFGTGGEVTTDFGATDVAVQRDGKIVVAGSGLARYTPDGTPDPTFGTGGEVATDFWAAAVAIQLDGKTVVAGSFFNGSNDDFALARYNPDGTLDPTFGTGGKVTTDFFGDWDDANALAIQGDGKVVVAGTAFNNTNPDFALTRYNADGTLDPTFGTGGKVTTDFHGQGEGCLIGEAPFAVAIQEDGKIVAAGFHCLAETFVFALARYNPDGALDPTFGTGGKVDIPGSSRMATAAAIQGDGKIVAAGGCFGDLFFCDYQPSDFFLARLNPDGTLDPTFGVGGKVTTDFGGGESASDLAIQGGGKLVAAGSGFLARYKEGGVAITSVNPATAVQGGTVQVKIQGAEFQPWAKVSMSGPGLAVVSTSFLSATNLAVKIAVAPDASVGPRDVTVTIPNGDTDMCPGCLVIDPGPKTTSISPDTGARGTTEDVDIFGSDFQPGAKSGFGSGITVNSTTFVSPGQLTANITIDPGAATGSRSVIVRNPDWGKGTCPHCFTVT